MVIVHRRIQASYTREAFCREAAEILALVRPCRDVRSARTRLFHRMSEYQFDTSLEGSSLATDELIIVRDCARALRGVLKKSSDVRAGFSVVAAIWDIANGTSRPDLGPGFFAELIHLFRGVAGRATCRMPDDIRLGARLAGREAATARSRELDRVWTSAARTMERYPDGLSPESVTRRAGRREHILEALGGSPEDWSSWRWQVRHIIRRPELLGRLVRLDETERASVSAAIAARLPFGVTPHYASLMDDDPEVGRDRAIRAQVLPPASYVEHMRAHHGAREQAFDFMLERDTSPVDLVTRRYPAIAILKPFNTCPQICVYCQRNWEIDDAMAPHALAAWEKIEAACRWIEEHPAICEVLVTGGDPLALPDATLERILSRLARIGSVDLIRIGSRTPVTLPMRITDRLAALLGSFHEAGRREVCLVTHVQHAYEVTPDLVEAVDRLRRNRVNLYNQLVYTFYASRRFESARLRLLLRRVGIEPYYTFVPKGKDETRDYRVPLARLQQEQREESRLLPGLRRSDEAVYNVPGMGKNHLRAYQHRDLVSILPDGARLYEFHPWESTGRRPGHLGADVPILEYLARLQAIGEDPRHYSSIWYYF